MVVGAVEVIKRRNREQRIRIECVNPRESRVAIGFALAIAQAIAGKDAVPDGVGIGVDGNLVIVLPEGADDAKLITGIRVEDERTESAVAIGGIVDRLRDGGLQPVVAAIAVQTGVVGGARAVCSAADLIVGLIEAAGGENKIAFAIALETGAGDHVENSVGAIAEVGVVAAALDFEIVDVLGVDLRSEIVGDVGVGDGDAINEPLDLMAATHVEHVMGYVGGGNVVGDHLHAVGAVGA